MIINTRLIAARILVQVQQGKSLNNAITTVIAAYSQINRADRSLVQELSYGVLRWHLQLAYLATQLLTKSLKSRDQDVYYLILIGLYQLGYLNQPDYAVINETVKAATLLKKPWATGLINAVLRRVQRQGQQWVTQTITQADRTVMTAHPKWLLDALTAAWPAHIDDIIAANNAKPPLVLRINRLQITRDAYLQQLTECNIAVAPQVHCEDGVVLTQTLPIETLPGYADGLFAVQDGAAQLAATLLKLDSATSMLDACAAPGGKTAHMLMMAPPSTRCVAWDKAPARLAMVKENLQRLQLVDENRIQLQVMDAINPQQPDQLFDRILVDAPCSATGIIRRHPDIKLHRQPTDIEALTAIQLRLLQSLWSLLLPGGYLLYATCSVLPQENVNVVQSFLQDTQDAVHVPIDVTWGIAQSLGRQILPGMHDMDGFYYALLTKQEE